MIKVEVIEEISRGTVSTLYHVTLDSKHYALKVLTHMD